MSAQKLITDHLDLWTGAATSRSTAGRGRSGKIELTGIKKLRELILELAVRGKLVEQDPNDEPASVLLEKIAEEKARLVKEGKIKKPKKLPEINEDEAPFSIPHSWALARLGESVEIVRGITFPASEKSSVPESGRVGCLRTSNVQEKIEWEDLLYIRSSFVSKESQYIQENDIVISMANSRELVGKVAIIGHMPNEPTTFGGFLGVIRPIIIHPRFLMAVLRSPHARTSLIGSASQTTNIANISIGKLNPFVIGIPPVEEQHRIVEKVDELMALCDRLEQQVGDQREAHEVLVDTLLGSLFKPAEGSLTRSADASEVAENWTRIAEHFDTLFTTEASIDKLKQTILQLAVMGRLVEQDPNDEPASVLLEKIADEKARLVKEGNYRKQKSLGKFERKESLYPTPPNWEWRTIDSVSIVQGGIQKQPKRAPKINHYPYLRVADVQRGSLSDCEELPRFELSDNEIEQYKLNNADILIVEGNGSADEIGRCAIWDGRISSCVYQNHLIRVRPACQGLSQFIALFLNSPSGIEEMKRLAVTTSGLYNLSVGKIRNIIIPIAPLTEQYRIVEKVDELMALCDQLKARLGEAGETRTHLAEAVVEKAVS